MKLISISGASGSGKTTLANLLTTFDTSVILISMDNYYLNEKEQIKKNGFCNFDHPSSFDYELLIRNIKELSSIGTTKIPQYCFEKRDRVGYKTINTQELLIVEGLYASKLLLAESNMSIYIDIDLDLALIRRIQRDLNHRNRTLESVIKQYLDFVRPAYIEYLKDIKLNVTKVIQNNGLENDLGYIAMKLNKEIGKING